jgi:cytidylate kinase
MAACGPLDSAGRAAAGATEKRGAMPIVTISRQYASGGGEIAEQVAQRLGATLIDRQFIDEVASRLGVPGEVVLEKDERGESLITRLARSLRLSYPDLAMPAEMTTALFTDFQELEDLPLQQAIEQLIRQAASGGNAVIVGRGGVFILRDEPHTLHVHVYAARPFRVETAMRREGIDLATAERKVEETDKERARYIKGVFKADWEALRHYHLMLSTSRLGLATATDLIVQAAQAVP